MSAQLAGKRCLIVGGTSGIGRAAVERFVAEGARVIVAGLEPAPGALVTDVRDPSQVDELIRSTCGKLGGLDVLYHVAGSSGRQFGDGSLDECSDAGWQATLEANLTGVFHTNRSTIRHFLANNQRGVILNMASVLAFAPSPRFFDTAAYTAAKGGIIALSRLAAARYAPHHIRVNVIAPGLIDTPMSARAVNDPEILAYLRDKQPLAEGPGTPEDCAGAAVFLCSDAAALITGMVLPADGGWSVSEALP